MGIYSINKNNIKIEDKKEKIKTEVIEEASTERRYKCPFCDYRDTRENLVFHVEEEHQDMIPEGYTPSRIVFNHLNKKEHGSCIICHKETQWREDITRYDRLCDNKKCHDKYVEQVQSRMINKYGKKNLLGDPEHQKKMLANRAISGEYKFKDGGKRSYCGSYEKKLLEFLDTVFNVQSKDVITPGPTIEYEYKGQTLSWITDVFYVPFNLVMDVKDGGDNPNNRQMDDYRAKQVAKEKAIANLKQYNYLRLTDNNFEQLLLIMNKIKKQLIDNPDSEDIIVDINEYTSIASVNPVVNNNDIYLIPYGINNSFIDSCISTDKYFNKLFTIDDEGNVVEESVDFLFEHDFSTYKYKGNKMIDELKSLVEQNKISFYNALSGKQLLSLNQISLDENFEEVNNPYEEKTNKIRSVVESIEYQYKSLTEENITLPITNVKDISIKESILREYHNIDIKQDMNGYFVYNETTQCRSKSYDKINDIPKDILSNINCNSNKI